MNNQMSTNGAFPSNNDIHINSSPQPHDSTPSTNEVTLEDTDNLLAPVSQQIPVKPNDGGQRDYHSTSVGSQVQQEDSKDSSLKSIELLHYKFDAESENPDKELTRYFTSCDTDLTNEIVARVNSLVDLIPFQNVPSDQAAQRRIMIKKIYYQVLKDMLAGEEKRLRKSNFTTLLSNDNFHKSHVICSAESVLFAYNQTNFDFTNLLTIFLLEPFELSVVIESFVHHAHWLSSSFKRHFRTVEERLLDSIVWKSGSVLYSKIDHQQDSIPPPHPGSETPLHKKRSRMFSVYSNETSEQSTQQPAKGPGSLAVQFFFRKIYRLASQRITDLCAEFNQRGLADNRIISPEIMRQILQIVWHVLNQKNNLLLDRHIDHIIMCSMYAVCNKVNRMQWVSFKEIMNNHRAVIENSRSISPDEVSKIFEVIIEDDKSGDLVKFYNAVFIPSVKETILQSSPKSTIPLPDTPGEIMSPSKQIRVSKTAKVFVSPLRSPVARNQVLLSPNAHMMGFPNSMTPRTRALYSFKDAYTERVNPNSMASPLLPAPSSAKRSLDFSDTPENTESPRKFRRLANSPSARRSITFEEAN